MSRFSGLLANETLVPSVCWDSVWEWYKAIYMAIVHCLSDGPFPQRCKNNINFLQASPMSKHLIAHMQGLTATCPAILLKIHIFSMSGNPILLEAFQHWLNQRGVGTMISQQ